MVHNTVSTASKGRIWTYGHETHRISKSVEAVKTRHLQAISEIFEGMRSGRNLFSAKKPSQRTMNTSLFVPSKLSRDHEVTFILQCSPQHCSPEKTTLTLLERPSQFSASLSLCPFSSGTIVLHQGRFCPPRDIRQCQETLLVFTTGGEEGVVLTSSEERPRMLLTSYRTAPPPPPPKELSGSKCQ